VLAIPNIAQSAVEIRLVIFIFNPSVFHLRFQAQSWFGFILFDKNLSVDNLCMVRRTIFKAQCTINFAGAGAIGSAGYFNISVIPL
jgi:hypothetical protein